MAGNKRITELTTLLAVDMAADDLVPVIDVSAALGLRSKKTTVADLAAVVAAVGGVYQPLDFTLTALAGQNWAANTIPVGTGADAVAQVAVTSNTFLARGSAGNVAAKPVTDFALALLDDASASQMRTTLGLTPGVDVQAFDADLATWAGLTPSANAQSLVTAANYAAMRALLDLEAGTDFYSVFAADTLLALKSPLASPTFTGVPAGPTAGAGTNTTQLATTAFVQAAISTAGGTYQPLDAALTAMAAGSDFVQFTGPSTTTKVFTLPNSSETLLYSGGPLGTPASGVATNLTGTAASLTSGLATALLNPRTIFGLSFDGTANIGNIVTGGTASNSSLTLRPSSFVTPVAGADIIFTVGAGEAGRATNEGAWTIANLQDKAGQVFNVKAYGAVGNGIASDTVAVQAAITAAQAVGGQVYLPAGTHLVAGLVITGRVDFVGAGWSSILKSSSAATQVLSLGAGATKSRLSNFQIQGAATSDASGQYGIWTDTSSMPDAVRVENVLFSGPDSSTGLNNGIKIDAGADWVISKCRFERLIGTVSGSGYGVLIGPSLRAQVTDCEFIGATGQGRHAVYLSTGASYSKVTGNICVGFYSTPFTIFSTSGQAACTHNEISHNTVIGGGHGQAETAGIDITANVQHSSILDNTIISFDGEGISISDAGSGGLTAHNLIARNKIYSCTLRGIAAWGTKNTLIQNNLVYNCSQASLGSVSNISVHSSSTAGAEVSDGVRIIGNVSYGTQNRNAINIDSSAPAPTNTVIAGNDTRIGNVGNINYAGVTVRDFGNTSSITGAIDLDLTGGTLKAGIQDKGGQVFNVKAYGAIGDGSTDDTAAFQAAVTACQSAGGGIVWLDGHTYLITGTITISSSSVNIVGAGSSAVTIQFAPTGNGPCFLFTKGALVIARCSLRGVLFNSADTTFTKTMISLNDVSSFVIDDVKSIDGGWTGATSIGLNIFGREFIYVANFAFYADIPLKVSLNPNYASYNLDLATFRNGQLAVTSGISQPNVLFVDGSAFTNILFENVDGARGINFLSFNNTLSGTASQCITFTNCRHEQAISGSTYSLDIRSSNSQLHMVRIESFQSAIQTNGIRLTGCWWPVIDQFVHSQGAGTAISVDSTVNNLALRNIFYQTGSSISGLDTVSGYTADNLCNGASAGTNYLANLTALNLSVATTLLPLVDDALQIGSTTKRVSDYFAAAGHVTNYNNGNVTVTHSADKLTLKGNLDVDTGNIVFSKTGVISYGIGIDAIGGNGASVVFTRDGSGNDAIRFFTVHPGISAGERAQFDSFGDFLLTDGGNIQFGGTTGTKIGTATSQKIGMHNATPTIQRASADQAAVTTTGATQVTPWGFASEAQANAIITLLNELRAFAVEKGLIKGSA